MLLPGTGNRRNRHSFLCHAFIVHWKRLRGYSLESLRKEGTCDLSQITSIYAFLAFEEE